MTVFVEAADVVVAIGELFCHSFLAFSPVNKLGTSGFFGNKVDGLDELSRCAALSSASKTGGW